ncbi:hypothetical protein HPB52_018397 [Rhipicephalus sanguineus]|uniref:Endonuclease/exonuclease/phosphatase domain-containing protein n=1 Tax=Rhipicephalus sanguineus TaxID=34632 RepID=A0A9D4SWM1_RHISA|nr:hypothetical protein HPB52_018397 [Rhipicephalus sanguineus]
MPRKATSGFVVAPREHSYAMVQILPLRRTNHAVYILNVYTPPKTNHVIYADIFCRALKCADSAPLVITGDFNAPCRLRGYTREEARGRRLAELISTLSLTLLTDPATPTRLGNSTEGQTSANS